MSEFMQFLHTSTRQLDEDDGDVLYKEWCLGAALEAPQYQNFIMRAMFSWDSSMDNKDSRQKALTEDANTLDRIGIVFLRGCNEGEHENHKCQGMVSNKI